MNRLRELRNEKRLTLREMAESIRIDKSTLSRYERGEQEIKVSDLNLFCDFFNVSADYLLGNSDVRSISSSTSMPTAKEQLSQYKLAFYNQAEEITEEQAKEILGYIEYVKNRDSNKK